MRYATLLFVAVLAGCATTLVAPPGMSSEEADRARSECQRDASRAPGNDWDRQSLNQRCLQDKGFQPS